MDITRSRLCGCALLGHSTDIPFRSFAHVCLRFPYGPQASTDSTHQHLCQTDPIFMQTERNKQSSQWEDLQQPSQKLPHQVESLTVFFCVCVFMICFCFVFCLPGLVCQDVYCNVLGCYQRENISQHVPVRSK